MATSHSNEDKLNKEADYTSDSDSDDGDSPCLCTFAVTGANPAYQPILICLDCSSQDEGICICQSCAQQCHAGHAVDYIAMGPSYCDCQQIESNSCLLKGESEKEAARLAVSSKSITHVAPPLQTDGTYVQEVFTISSLDDKLCDRLTKEASELVKHSKDTHWIDLHSKLNEKYSKLEELAHTILDRHVKEYQLCSSDTGEFHGGAEWWVQVKRISLPTSEETRLDTVASTEDEAVDLHFDKDEVLAESFDLGSFPTLSTVTYLTATHNASPTVVFPHTFDKDEEVMDEMLVSYPRRGKHLVFDGRLLHGAPAHHALRSIQNNGDGNAGKSDESLNRVTFLVNVWVNQQPSGVKPLSSEVRQLVRTAGKKKKLSSILQQHQKTNTAEFVRRAIKEVRLENEDDLPESIRGRIELPFVSKGATWISQGRGSGLVVVTFPPPSSEVDTMRVKFGPGLQAYLEYQDGQDEERFKVAGQQVDYV